MSVATRFKRNLVKAKKAGNDLRNEFVMNAAGAKKIGKDIYDSKGKGLGKNLVKLAKNPLVGLSLYTATIAAGTIANRRRKNKKEK